MLVGRIISLALNLAGQVLIVRYLSKSDYGAFAFVLATLQSGAAINLFGFHKTLPRFLPLYQERKEFGKLAGSIVFAALVLVVLGIVFVALVQAFPDTIARALRAEAQTVALLTMFAIQLPVEAADLLLIRLLASFAGARSVFFRRHVLGPGLRLIAVVAVVVVHGDVFLLAKAYLSASLLGIAIYVAVLLHTLRRRHLLTYFRWGSFSMPGREILGFSLPLVSTDVLLVVRGVLVLYLLEYFHPTSVVAEYRAVVPTARMSTLVEINFVTMFVPIAARLFSKNDITGVRRMQARTALWVMVLTYPVFACCFVLAGPLTVTLFGARYADSAATLAILAVGFYVSAVFGFNVESLKVLGKVRSIVLADALTTVVALILNFALIPRYGAAGAAAAVTGTFLAYALSNEILLRRAIGDAPADERLGPVALRIFVAVVLLGVLNWAVPLPLPVGIVLVAGSWLVIVRSSRAGLKVDDVFPELARLPWLLKLVGIDGEPVKVRRADR